MENLELTIEDPSKSIEREVILVLEQMTSDWDLGYSGGIGPDTLLISDLVFESIDMVQFVVTIEEHFHRRDLPFEKLLMVNGRYIDDLSVSEVVNFLQEHLNGDTHNRGEHVPYASDRS